MSRTQFRAFLRSGITSQLTASILREHFSQFGDVADVHIVKGADGTPRGFAFVSFTHEDGLHAATKEESHLICDTEVSVVRAEPRGERREGERRHERNGKGMERRFENGHERGGFGGTSEFRRGRDHFFMPSSSPPLPCAPHLSHSLGSPDAFMLQQHHLQRVSALDLPSGLPALYGSTALLKPVEQQASPIIMSAPPSFSLPPTHLATPHGPTAVASPPASAAGSRGGGVVSREDENRIYVGGVPDSITSEDVRTHFSKYGNVTDVYFPKERAGGKRRGFCYVRFDTFDAADTAVARSQRNINGVDIVEIRMAIPRGSNIASPHALPHNQPQGMSVLADGGSWGSGSERAYSSYKETSGRYRPY